MKTTNKLIISLLISILCVDFYKAPPPPPGGGGGGTTPGAPATPIDIYIFLLIIVAFATIFYSKKLLKQTS